MKRIFLLLPIVLSITVGIPGCSLPFSISGNGILVSESRSVSDFGAISIGGSGHAVITQGDSESLEIQADENLLPYIHSVVHHGELRIWLERGNLRFTKRPVYTLSVRELDHLQLSGALNAEIAALKTDRFKGGVSGSGSVRFGDLEADSVEFDISGSGKLIVDNGTAESLRLGVSGSGDLNTSNCRAENVEISISGSGSAQVWATDSLSAHVSGSGQIDYKGSPQVSSSISGSGRIGQL